MKLAALSLLFLSSCLHTLEEHRIVHSLSPKRQKQKIITLQKKLEQAEKEQRKAQETVEELIADIEEAKLTLIRKQINEYERKKGENFPLFLEEKEALRQIIQAGPSEASFAAQIELDRLTKLTATP